MLRNSIDRVLKKIASRWTVKHFSVQELNYLSELLNTDLPLKTCLKLIESDNNQKIISSFILRLEQGELIEEIIGDYLPVSISAYIKDLVKSLSLKEALNLALQFEHRRSSSLKKLQKELVYPIVLLFASMTGLFLFDRYGLNSIISLLRQFNTGIGSFVFFRSLLRVMVYVLYVGFIICSLLFLYFRKPKRIVMLYVLISKYKAFNIVKSYFSAELVSMMLICRKAGFHTKQTLDILRSLSSVPVTAFLSFHLSKKLEEGKSLKEAFDQSYFDDSLKRFTGVAAYSLNYDALMANYSELQMKKVEDRIHFYTKIVQSVSYAMIGFAIVFIYQVLFLPMQALINF
ncbi:MAG: type II secretion system F family protein [Erysipelotrichaceae bacterium]